LSIAEKYKIPILADEVYYGIVYPGKEFHPFANLNKDVPIMVLTTFYLMCYM
jgi:tyrosine aminotransferase